MPPFLVTPSRQAALDALVAQYKTPAYIDNDPIQIPYRYVSNPLACEMVAFVTALFSYGRRERIISTMTAVFDTVGADPMGFLEGFSRKRHAALFRRFVHRFNTGEDLIFLWESLQRIYGNYGSLEAAFAASLPIEREQYRDTTLPADLLQAGISRLTELLLGNAPPERNGLKFLLAHPGRGGACKRFNMYLRWMVRHDAEESGRVDFGLWRNALHPRDLRVPLDTHVLKMNRSLGLTPRNDGSWKTVEAITAVFRQLCREDPIKYDYALFGFSLDKRPIEAILSPS